MKKCAYVFLFVALTLRPAHANPWGLDLSLGWTVDGLQSNINTRYVWASHEVIVGMRAYPTGLRDDWPLGGQAAYHFRFAGDWVRPVMGPEYQLTRHRGGTLHTLFWSYGVELPLKYGLALEQSLGLGAGYLSGARLAALETEVLARFAIVYRADW